MIFFFILLQILAVVIIGGILKVKLNRLLLDTGIKELLSSGWAKTDEQGRVLKTGKVMVVTQHFLKEADRNRIIKAIAHYFQNDLPPHFAVDPNIWGGIIFQWGEQRIDCSLKTRIAQLFDPNRD